MMERQFDFQGTKTIIKFNASIAIQKAMDIYIARNNEIGLGEIYRLVHDKAKIIITVGGEEISVKISSILDTHDLNHCTRAALEVLKKKQVIEHVSEGVYRFPGSFNLTECNRSALREWKYVKAVNRFKEQ